MIMFLLKNYCFYCVFMCYYILLTGKSPQRVVLVELLSKVLCDNVPDLWRLGQSYLSGKLLKEVTFAYILMNAWMHEFAFSKG